ncbi:unnamed protein product [Kuraishia capsulata CBS 1993]|uniref:Factor arrest protein 11 n=1 Tax=Kuraishia capsulata CBS 1993 TaxID=1382522 RepID=W6MF51_9ASCO|nr:uncharacterized protein KUCA_T00000239001 [Kuraishia capsulata CBS 1993]CDK24279.1 unnamed protein product [Kuraishia capsulata CBS 1993]
MPEISREAALFEEANIEDIGAQPELFQARRRSSSHRAHQNQSPKGKHSPVRNGGSFPDNNNEEIEPETFPTSICDNEEVIAVDEEDLPLDPNEILPSPVPSPMTAGEAEDQINDFNIVLEYPELEYEYTDSGLLSEEIRDWFTSSDMRCMTKLKLISEKSSDFGKFYDQGATSQKNALKNCLTRLLKNLEYPKRGSFGLLQELVYILYSSLGSYGNINGTDHQLERIRMFAPLLLTAYKIDGQSKSILSVVANVILEKADAILATMDSSPVEDGQTWDDELFYSLTILYISITVFLDSKDDNLVSEQMRGLSQILSTLNFLPRMLSIIDKWRWLASDSDEKKTTTQNVSTPHNIRIRNILMLLWKSVSLLFGDSRRYKATKEFLKARLETDKTSEKWEKITPFDYHLYKNELIARYPSLRPQTVELPALLNMTLEDQSPEPSSLETTTLSRSSSMSSIEVVQSILFNPQIENGKKTPNNVPDIHIATPATSPRLVPALGGSFSSNSLNEENLNGRSKKFFFTNPSFPNIYPIDIDDQLPYSIQQAGELFFSNVRQDIYTKQMIATLEEFLHESQITSDKNAKNEVDKGICDFSSEDLKKNPLFVDEVTSLMYVEEFYSLGLKNLDSLVVVFMKIMSSNVERVPQSEKEIEKLIELQKKSAAELTKREKQQLEIQKLKEISLKATSSTAFMLQKWFKLSHFLKFEYFNGLLLDNGFFPTLLRFLNSNFQKSQISSSLDYGDDLESTNKTVYCSYEKLSEFKDYDFFKQSLALSSCSSGASNTLPVDDEQPDDGIESGVRFTGGVFAPFGFKREKISKINRRHCFILTNLFHSLYMTISKNKIRQTIEFLETRPSETLRFYLSFYNVHLYKPILKIIKLIIPFNGKKWRSNNMDLISYVYLFEKIGLKDGWLSNAIPAGATDRIRKACDQEYALRSLVRFYHLSHYGHEFSASPLEYNRDDEFFQEELGKVLMEDFEGLNI